jgi:hypothetical protein
MLASCATGANGFFSFNCIGGENTAAAILILYEKEGVSGLILAETPSFFDKSQANYF